MESVKLSVNQETHWFPFTQGLRYEAVCWARKGNRQKFVKYHFLRNFYVVLKCVFSKAALIKYSV